MNLFKNDIDNDYLKIINDYFNEWLKIKTEEEWKIFTSKTPPKFGMFETSILNQINNFIDLGVKLECNEVTFKLFKDEIKNICEDLQVY